MTLRGDVDREWSGRCRRGEHQGNGPQLGKHGE
jgi:hypothetical protein